MKPFCWALVFDLEDGPSVVDFQVSKEAAQEAAEIIKCETGTKPRIIQLFSEDV